METNSEMFNRVASRLQDLAGTLAVAFRAAQNVAVDFDPDRPYPEVNDRLRALCNRLWRLVDDAEGVHAIVQGLAAEASATESRGEVAAAH